nr:MAG TPA: hypothetical protein [Caudoviricetes sp.]
MIICMTSRKHWNSYLTSLLLARRIWSSNLRLITRRTKSG